MQVQLRSSIGAGNTQTLSPAEGTRLSDFVRSTQGSGRFRVTVRSAGEGDFTVRSDNYNLREGDIISVSPADVKGATKPKAKAPVKKAPVKKAAPKKSK